MMAIPTLTTKEITRFWAKVEKTETCWNWTGAKNEKGYASFRLARDGKAVSVRVHRISYLLANNEDPGELHVDHMCHNRVCVNPAHLRACTLKQNHENRAGARKDSKSGVRGVFWDSRTKNWVAQVMHERKQMRVGAYATIAEAEQAAIAKRLEVFTHNFIDRQVAA